MKPVLLFCNLHLTSNLFLACVQVKCIWGRFKPHCDQVKADLTQSASVLASPATYFWTFMILIGYCCIYPDYGANQRMFLVYNQQQQQQQQHNDAVIDTSIAAC